MGKRKDIDKDREYLLAEIVRLVQQADRRQLDILLAFLETLKTHPDY